MLQEEYESLKSRYYELVDTHKAEKDSFSKAYKYAQLHNLEKELRSIKKELKAKDKQILTDMKALVEKADSISNRFKKEDYSDIIGEYNSITKAIEKKSKEPEPEPELEVVVRLSDLYRQNRREIEDAKKERGSVDE